VRELLAQLGFRKLEDAIGQVEVLDTRAAAEHWKASGLDLSPILVSPKTDAIRRNVSMQDHGLSQALDNQLITLANSALENQQALRINIPIRNVNRTVGTMLGSEITRRFGGKGLPANTIDITFHGSAGQSFGAFIPSGLTLRLYGDSNDYVAKGLSGGRVIIRPDERAKFKSNSNVIAGNVIGYGATSGEIMISGVVGERFCVRNSGAHAVVEGVGDHGCEYMTGGTVIILGGIGRNFAAGMSGGMAFVIDLNESLVNTEMVDLLALPSQHEEFLKASLSNFFVESGSSIAKEILDDWQKNKNRFTLVMPRDYARVLDVMAKAQREGMPIDSAVMEVVSG
jgi:glutamate synthase (NADPH/NADH) large chain